MLRSSLFPIVICDYCICGFPRISCLLCVGFSDKEAISTDLREEVASPIRVATFDL